MNHAVPSPADLLRDLVAIPSVNPMGREVEGPDYLEGRVTAYLMAFFERLGVPHQSIEVLPGSHNVLARFDNPGAKTTLLLDAHQDTVPVEGMTIPPFTPTVRDGRMYGRGSCDVKGGLATILSVLARLMRERPSGRAKRRGLLHVRRRAVRSGAKDLVKLWTDPSRAGVALLARRAGPGGRDGAHGLDIVVAHRGRCGGNCARAGWRVTARGRTKGSMRSTKCRVCWRRWSVMPTSYRGWCPPIHSAAQRR